MLVKVAFLVLFCMAVQPTLFAPHAEAAVSCVRVQGQLTPCLGFLQGRQLDPKCCTGVTSVVGSARTVLDRRAICRCLVAAAKSMPGMNFGNAAALPGRCLVRIPYPINPTTDCARIG